MSLKIGDHAPDFESKDQDGNAIKLSDYHGKKVVLYFYPKDNTPGCTAQSCDLRDHYQTLLDQNYAVLGVSTDGEKSHKKFIEKFELPFPLIADEDKSVHQLYGTWAEKSMYGKTYMGTVRTTFIISEEGKIEEIIEKVKIKEHSSQILKI